MSEMLAYHCLAHPAAVLRVMGPDAFPFLQSQFSNDLKVEGVEHPVTYGLWLDHKGKIQADSFVIQKSREDFWALSYDCPVALLRGHLESHLIADEVELRDETGALELLHVWAERYDESFAELVEERARAAGAESWMGRRPTAYSSWDILALAAALEQIARDLEAQGVEPAPAEAMQAARLMAGVPAVPSDAGPGDLPQEAGLAREGVSFDKGCYAGQEIMSRLHTQGHVNRALWQLTWEGDAPVEHGAPVRSLYAGAELAGELRSHVVGHAGGLGLAMLKKRALPGQVALSFAPNGPKRVRLLRDLTEG